ncbi:MAG TPA: protein kinase [Planctomycetota bacterium]
MPLAPGQELSFYTLLAPLGAGGMGEVWRARDNRLGREVAIKVLPESFAGDEERLRRFEREARTLAALSHPNVAQIHGIDQVGDTCFLALELVGGEDLAQRLARGPLALEEALDVCRQIAEGLGAAHDAGVVHRDLKPANVRRTPEGVVKVLDFGLARQDGVATSGSGTPVPRPDSFLVTEAGLVLGTPTYMSPEQARGKLVDRRTDVWAFGCVLYECLTGRRAFEGAALADILAAIVQREPDYSLLPAATPPRVRALLRRTLEKDPRQRLQHLGDARVELERALAEPGASATGPRGAPARPALVAGILGLGAGLALGWLAPGWLGSASPASAREHGPRHVAVPILPSHTGIHPRLAPDGRAVVFAAVEPDGRGDERPVLYLRRLDATEPVRLPGTERPSTLCYSPDGTSIAVAHLPEEGGVPRLVEVRLGGGTPRTVPLGSHAPEPNSASGMVWTETGLLVVGGERLRLLVRPVAGGAWQELPIQASESLAGASVEVYRALPGGRHVLGHSFTYGAEGFEPVLLAIEVASGVARKLATGGFGAWSGTGQLLFTRGGALFALDLEPETLTVRGEPRLLLEGLRTRQVWLPGWFDLARDGTLLHEPGGPQGREREVVLLTREGEVEPWLDERHALDGMISLAPDGSFLVAAMVAASGLVELWTSELDAPLLRPLLSDPRADFLPGPIDTQHGWIYFTRLSQDGQEGLWRTTLAAPERVERIWTPPDVQGDVVALALSPDGANLLVYARTGADHGVHEVAVGPGGAGVARLMLALPGEPRFLAPSPDGGWLASQTDSPDGRSGVLLRRRRADGSFGPAIPLPRTGTGDPWTLSWALRPAGARPALLLSPDGRRILEIELESDQPPRFSAPRLVAVLDGPRLMSLISLPDGRLLALLRGEEEFGFERVELVLGFDELLRGPVR